MFKCPWLDSAQAIAAAFQLRQSCKLEHGATAKLDAIGDMGMRFRRYCRLTLQSSVVKQCAVGSANSSAKVARRRKGCIRRGELWNAQR
jgi:hypothetical protein